LKERDPTDDSEVSSEKEWCNEATWEAFRRLIENGSSETNIKKKMLSQRGELGRRAGWRGI